MEDKVLVVYKPLCWTPLQVIDRLREANASYADSKITYVGRLDPMAEGVMILLVDEMIADKDLYLSLNKTYEFQLLLGIKTDTFDVMGIPQRFKPIRNRNLITMRLKDLIKDLIGPINQNYPSFSGKTINGIKMFDLAKQGILSNFKIPKKSGEIYDIELLNSAKIHSKGILKNVVSKLNKVDGDFRQSEIILAWKEALGKNDIDLLIIDLKINCSSGIFVRSICDDLGEKLGCGGIAYTIKRTAVGGYTLEDCLYLEDN